MSVAQDGLETVAMWTLMTVSPFHVRMEPPVS